jgi:MFS family permease
MGVLLLNAYGHFIPRRRAIEGGLIALGVLLMILTAAGPLSRFLRGLNEDVAVVDLSALTSLVAVVIAVAFLCGIAYGVVAIASQTQLQEDLPEDVRGRVFGVLNMLVSVSSLLPIILVGYISDQVGTTAVILAVSIAVVIAGLFSIFSRGPLQPEETKRKADERVPGTAVDPIGVTMRTNGRPRPD